MISIDVIMPEQEDLKIMRELRRDFPTTGLITMPGGSQIGCDTLHAVAER